MSWHDCPEAQCRFAAAEVDPVEMVIVPRTGISAGSKCGGRSHPASGGWWARSSSSIRWVRATCPRAQGSTCDPTPTSGSPR